MKKLLSSLFMVVLMAMLFTAVPVEAEVHKAYVQASHGVDFTNPAFTSNDIDLTARLKSTVVKGGGFDVSADYNTGSTLDGASLTTGLFYQVDKFELAVGTTFPADDFTKFGKDSRVTLGYGIGF